MRITTKPPEPVMTLSLRDCAEGVKLFATTEAGEEQAVMLFTNLGDNRGDNQPQMTAYTLRIREGPAFPIFRDAHGHINVRMKV